MDLVGKKIASSWGKCISLNEATIKLVPSATTSQVLAKYYLIGKVLTSRSLGEREVEAFCGNPWKTHVKVDTPFSGRVATNVFRFGFEKVADRRRVLDNGPWCVKGFSLVLLAWPPGFGTLAPSFTNIRLWIQIHFLPHDYFSRINANILGAQAGKVLFIDLDESRPFSWNKWIQLNESGTRESSKAAKRIDGKKRMPTLLSSPVSMRGNGSGAVGDGSLPGSRKALVSSAGQRLRSRFFKAWVPKMVLKAQEGGSRVLHFSGKSRTNPRMDRGNEPAALPNLEDNSNLGVIFEGDKERSPLTPVPLLDKSVGLVKLGNKDIGPGSFVGRDDWVNKLNTQMLGDAVLGDNSGRVIKAHDTLTAANANLMGGPGPMIIPVGLSPSVRSKMNIFEGDYLVGGNCTSFLGRDSSSQHEEKRALASFFQAQEDYIKELDALGYSGKNKRKSFGIVIGVQPTSDCNERTTPVKKWRLDLETSSLGKRPFVPLCRVKRVVRDYPRGTGPVGGTPEPISHDQDASSEEPMDSDEVAKIGGAKISTDQSHQVENRISVGQYSRLTAWKACARPLDISIPTPYVLLIEDVGSAVDVRKLEEEENE
ncbi:hypothetical protein G4B88_031347 [Cannabis sativa]|uniref:DUF4283 domain-containing protein n=1 Tax=Cannabis sativa TaxID=3483 RepID=A0A7J6GGA2_CANSA|nr:hypothetical protein G4B88_031347 [Cannabis sativa]